MIRGDGIVVQQYLEYHSHRPLDLEIFALKADNYNSNFMAALFSIDARIV